MKAVKMEWWLASIAIGSAVCAGCSNNDSPFTNYSASPVAPRKTRAANISILGKWRVVSSKRDDLKNHTYEFFPNRACVEKYLSEQTIGPSPAGDQYMEMEFVTTYWYRPLGSKRYRLFPIKETADGKSGDPTFSIRSRSVIEITIVKDKAIVDIVERHKSNIQENIEKDLDALQDTDHKGKNVKVAKKESEVWVRMPAKS